MYSSQKEIKIKVHNTPDSPHLINDIETERANLRRQAMAAKNVIELQACGRVKDFVFCDSIVD